METDAGRSVTLAGLAGGGRRPCTCGPRRRQIWAEASPTLISGTYPSGGHRTLGGSTGTQATWVPHAAGHGPWPAQGWEASPRGGVTSQRSCVSTVWWPGTCQDAPPPSPAAKEEAAGAGTLRAQRKELTGQGPQLHVGRSQSRPHGWSLRSGTAAGGQTGALRRPPPGAPAEGPCAAGTTLPRRTASGSGRRGCGPLTPDVRVARAAHGGGSVPTLLHHQAGAPPSGACCRGVTGGGGRSAQQGPVHRRRHPLLVTSADPARITPATPCASLRPVGPQEAQAAPNETVRLSKAHLKRMVITSRGL